MFASRARVRIRWPVKRCRGTCNEKGDRMEVEMKIRGLMMDPVTNMPIVILKDINGNAILPIWVGIYEANAIALGDRKGFDAPAHDARSDQDAAASAWIPESGKSW